MGIDTERTENSSSETGIKHSEYASSYDRRQKFVEMIEKTKNNPDLTPEEKSEIIADYKKALDSIV